MTRKVKTVRITDLSDFGAFLKSVRRERGLTLDKLEEKTGVTTNTISSAESGKRNFSSDTFLKLCDALGVDFMGVYSVEVSEPDLKEQTA